MATKQIIQLPNASAYNEATDVFAIQQNGVTAHISGSELGYATDAELVAASGNLMSYANAASVVAAQAALNAANAVTYAASANAVVVANAYTDAVSGSLAASIASIPVQGITGSTFTNKIAYGYTDKGVTYDANFSYDPANMTIDAGSIILNGNYGAPIELAAGSTAFPSMVMDEGVAPSTPADGATWMTSAGIYYKSGGTIKGPLGVGGITASEVAGISGTLYSFADSASANALVQAKAYTDAASAALNTRILPLENAAIKLITIGDMTSGQSIDNTYPIVKYNVMVTNDSSCYDTSTGRYNVIYDGMYTVHANITLDPISTQQVKMSVHKNATSTDISAVLMQYYRNNVSSGYQGVSTVSATVKCISGDYITVRAYCDSSKSCVSNLTRLLIAKVG